ncbi:hypothetical protein ACSQ67_000877 [Phaseolus vulgaris]
MGFREIHPSNIPFRYGPRVHHDLGWDGTPPIRTKAEIRTPKPSLVIGEVGPSVVRVHSDEGKFTTLDLRIKKRRVENLVPSTHSHSDGRAPEIEIIMTENWNPRFDLGVKPSFGILHMTCPTLEADVSRFARFKFRSSLW